MMKSSPQSCPDGGCPKCALLFLLLAVWPPSPGVDALRLQTAGAEKAPLHELRPRRNAATGCEELSLAEEPACPDGATRLALAGGTSRLVVSAFDEDLSW